MKGLRVLFQVAGEEPMKGKVMEHVTLPYKQKRDDDSGSIPISYYQIIDDNGTIHTISPASLISVVDETSKNDVYEALYGFLDFIRPRVKLKDELLRWNEKNKNNLEIHVDFGKKGVAVYRKGKDEIPETKIADEEERTEQTVEKEVESSATLEAES